MGLRDLTFKIFAQDKTGRAFDQVEQKLRGVDGAAASLNDRVRRVGQGMQSFGARASVASAGILVAFRDSLSLYETQRQAEAKVAAAIEATGGAAGRTAKELGAMASQLQKASNFGDEDILSGAIAPLLTFTKIAGAEFDKTLQTAVDMSTFFGTDLQSSAIQLGKALSDPARGLSALRRIGVTFTADQEAVIKSLAETNRLAEAQSLILDAINSQGIGGAAAAAVDPLQQLSMAFGDLKEVVGGVVMPILVPMVQALVRVAEGFQALDPRVQTFIVAGGALAVAIGPLVALLGMIAVGAAALGGPISLAIAAFVGLSAAAFALRDDIGAAWSFIREKFEAMPEWVARMARGIRDNLLSAINPFRALRGAVEDAEAGFAWLYDRVVGNSWVPDMIDEIGAHFGRLGAEMTTPAEVELRKVDAAFDGLERDIGGRLGRMAATGKVTWRGFMGDLLDIGADYRAKINREVFDGLASGALGKVGVDTAAPGGLGGFLGSAISSLGSGLFSSLPGFATGGAFSAASGKGGIDRNMAAFRVSRDEDVTVTKRGQGDGARPVVVNIYAQDVRSFEASRAQVGRTIGRALAAGQRGM